MRITILGCGSSLGVPALKYGWGRCDPLNPKNKRTRSSIVLELEHKQTTLLVDTSPDLREQLLKFGKQDIDAILFTHAHFDHTNGINELRPIYLHDERSLDIYGLPETLDQIKNNFNYLFKGSSHDIYDTYLKMHELSLGRFDIKDISGVCFLQNHGFSETMGFRVGNFAYCTDVTDFEDFSVLKNLDLWIVDCLNIDDKRPTHANLDLVLQWVDKVKPKMTYLTHMDSSMDYDNLIKILPPNIRPAYDQQVLYIDY